MVITDLLSQLDHVRRSGRGYMARCPGHADRRNSLKLDEGEDGRILLHCFAACSTEDILHALGLTLSDLFMTSAPRRGRSIKPITRRLNLRDTAGLLEDHATSLRIRAGRVLGIAHNLSIGFWSSKDLDRALGAVAGAYGDRERAQLLEDVAFDLRVQRLNQQREAHASRT